MSHTKDIDERNDPGHGAPAAADDAGLMLVDLLYGELDGNERERAERRVREDDALAGELEALSRIRSIMRELPDEEPPEALSTKLLHAAAAEVSGNRAPVARDEERPSVWERLRRLFMPLMMHPGLAAAASVILIGGVAGMLYVSNNLKVASPVAREAAGQAAPSAQTTAPDTAAMTMPPVAAGAQPDFGSPQAGAPAPTGAAVAEDPRAAGAIDGLLEGRGGERRQALDEARDEKASGATRRPPTNAELALADDYGAEEQSQGYFARAPAEESEPLARQEKGGKAGRASATSGAGDTAGLAGLDKNVAPSTRSDDARQKKEAESYRRAEPTPPKSKARSRDADGAGYDELASQLETGSSAGARAGNAPGASGGAAGGAPTQATPPPPQAAPASPRPAQPAPARTAPARKPSPERAAEPPPAEDRAGEAEDAEADAPAEGKKAAVGKAASNEASKERARKDTAARVLSLHKQALAAAARGDCATARTNMNTILRLDSTYHREYVARDARLQDCLAVKK